MKTDSKEYELLKLLYNYFDYKAKKAKVMDELAEYNEKAYQIMKLLYEAEYEIEFKESRQEAEIELQEAAARQSHANYYKN